MLKKAYGPAFDQIEIFEADLSDAQSLDKAVQGCDIVIHTAHSYPDHWVKDENELIKPAVIGMNAILKATIKYNVKRLICTATYENLISETNSSKLIIDEPFISGLTE